MKTKTKAKGLDPRKNLIFIVSITDVVVVFGWKARMNDSLSEYDCKALHELYEVVCAHTPTKKINSCSIFTKVVGSSQKT